MVRIYFEPQESQMCGQHALNNLIQSSFFDAGILSGIASELDGVEEAMMGKSNENSANVDDQGNFSIQVIKVGLERFKNIELELWHHRKGIQDIDPLKQTGFIIHSSDHWFTIRKINGKWWNLNSILAAPAPITDFFLSAFLAELRQSEKSVFIATGNLDPKNDGSMDSLDSAGGGGGKWYTEEELMSIANYGTNNNDNTNTNTNTNGGASQNFLYSSGWNNKNKEQQSSPAVNAFSGKGQRLDGRSHGTGTATLAAAGLGDEDAQLAMAIAASLADQHAPLDTSPVMDARAKRLAALEKRGL